MGRPKLLLPWGGQTIVRRLLSLLLDADVASVSILVRGDDESLLRHLQEFKNALSSNRASRLHVLTADPAPRDMRESVAELLTQVGSLAAPVTSDAWMLVPGDLVAIGPVTLNQLIDQWRRNPHGILVPTYLGQRGHPTLFGWKLLPQFERIPAGKGVNHLLSDPAIPVSQVEVEDAAVLADLDTPEDYARWQKGSPTQS